MCVCVCACVRACARVCVFVCVHMGIYIYYCVLVACHHIVWYRGTVWGNMLSSLRCRPMFVCKRTLPDYVVSREIPHTHLSTQEKGFALASGCTEVKLKGHMFIMTITQCIPIRNAPGLGTFDCVSWWTGRTNIFCLRCAKIWLLACYKLGA